MRDFDALWTEIEPWLDSLESRRRAAVARMGRSAAIGVGVGLLGLAITVSTDSVFPLVLAIMLAVLIMHRGGSDMRELGRTVKAGLNTKLAEAFGLTYSEKPDNPVHYREFVSHGLIPNADREEFEDHFSGKAHGAAFELYETHLQQRRRSRRRTYYVTVFRGALIRIAFPRTIEGVTLITRDRGIFNAFERWARASGKRSLERIGLPDPEFGRIFEVYGTDQVMARYLVTPSFMERLLQLEEALKGRNVRAVFDEDLADGPGRGEMLIAAETGNLFETGSLFSPLNDPGRVRALYNDIALIEQITAIILKPPRLT